MDITNFRFCVKTKTCKTDGVKYVTCTKQGLLVRDVVAKDSGTRAEEPAEVHLFMRLWKKAAEVLSVWELGNNFWNFVPTMPMPITPAWAMCDLFVSVGGVCIRVWKCFHHFGPANIVYVNIKIAPIWSWENRWTYHLIPVLSGQNLTLDQHTTIPSRKNKTTLMCENKS